MYLLLIKYVIIKVKNRTFVHSKCSRGAYEGKSNRNIKFISSMGTGNKFDPTKLKIMDLKKTSYDPLAKVIRHEINKLNITDNITVLSSTEMPVKTGIRTPASYSVVPNTAGILIADYILKDILNDSIINL